MIEARLAAVDHASLLFSSYIGRIEWQHADVNANAVSCCHKQPISKGRNAVRKVMMRFQRIDEGSIKT